MNKGDKFIDRRSNKTYTIDSVDVYEDVTLIFTDNKEYIPTQFIKVLDEDYFLLVEKFKQSIKPKNEKILTADEWLKKTYTNEKTRNSSNSNPIITKLRKVVSYLSRLKRRICN